MVERGQEREGAHQVDDVTTDAKSKARPVTPGREAAKEIQKAPEEVKEIGGPKGPEPTRFGDWEKGGRCSDF